MRHWVSILIFSSLFYCGRTVAAQTGLAQEQGGAADAHEAASGYSSSLDSLPEAPEPVGADGQRQRPDDVPWMGVVHYGRFSRVAIGADISPLGIGIKGATILSEKIDVRLMMNFFSLSANYGGADDIQDVGGTLSLKSLQTAVDFYPRNSIWRLSAGLLLWNGNQITAHGTETPGTSFQLPTCPAGATCPPYHFDNYYSSQADPFGMDMNLNLHPRQPAFTVSGGFGRFIPRSERHWSFPAEYGVVFMGNPTIKFTPFGSVCTGQTAGGVQSGCMEVADDAAFQADLQTYQQRLQRNALNHISIYPIFSYGVMYSFDIAGR